MRIVIAEDEALLRDGLFRLLHDTNREVVGVAKTATELIEVAERLEPSLVITDIRMPPTHTSEGLDAVRLLRRKRPNMAVLVLSQHVHTRGALELAAQGAGVGYLLKQRILDLERFLEDVSTVERGGSVIDPEVFRSRIDEPPVGSRVGRLTRRRREVLALMAQGYSNSRIARELVITEKAVARNIAFIFETLELPQQQDSHRRVLAVLEFVSGLAALTTNDASELRGGLE